MIRFAMYADAHVYKLTSHGIQYKSSQIRFTKVQKNTILTILIMIRIFLSHS